MKKKQDVGVGGIKRYFFSQSLLLYPSLPAARFCRLLLRQIHKSSLEAHCPEKQTGITEGLYTTVRFGQRFSDRPAPQQTPS